MTQQFTQIIHYITLRNQQTKKGNYSSLYHPHIIDKAIIRHLFNTMEYHTEKTITLRRTRNNILNSKRFIRRIICIYPTVLSVLITRKRSLQK